MSQFPLQELNDDEFEKLVILICNKILGEAIIPFTKGKDGGKDGRFIGQANCFPSESKPWDGKIIIQAKHTTKENASCSDSDFYTILKNEIISIQTLKQNGELDYYLLFTNRKLTGVQDGKIAELFNEQNVVYEIIANEKIQQLLQTYPDIVRTANLKNLLNPLEFDESDLKEIIIAINETFKKTTVLPNLIDFTKIEIEKKNELNQLSKSYFDDVMKRNFEYFNQIKTFLVSPINAGLKDLYDDTISELNAKITLRRNEFVEFENLLETFYDYTVNNNADLKGKKRLVRILLHYMYCNCDIGKKEN
ncbi:MAG: hypothetical protein LBP59_11165 [Planctomycetaceae bacterium]|jgi:hypothetical protein|nr:hypothetical protein [Planctomycetaceae bacterium]